MSADASRADRLDRASPLPLWAQLLAELRARLGAGEFDERFPAELELAADYGVSRNTA
ncbi:GntR family transcriptional regulator, partial [Acidimicrobiaceae bacterium USS-CC1]|nr:GntR family transcriptional regulator [Acidiferrimicrobium australe]